MQCILCLHADKNNAKAHTLQIFLKTERLWIMAIDLISISVQGSGLVLFFSDEEFNEHRPKYPISP